MAIAVVAHAIASNATNTATTTGVTTTGATAILVAVAEFTTSAVAAGVVTDSNSNTWYAVGPKQVAEGNAALGFFICPNPVVGASHTFTVTTSGLAPSIAVLAISGTGAGIFSCQGTNGSGTASSIQPGSITPLSNNNLLLCALSSIGTITSLAIDSGFTISDSVPSGPGEILGLAYLIQTSAAAVNPTWSWTTAHPISASMIGIAPSVSGGATTTGFASA